MGQQVKTEHSSPFSSFYCVLPHTIQDSASYIIQLVGLFVSFKRCYGVNHILCVPKLADTECMQQAHSFFVVFRFVRLSHN